MAIYVSTCQPRKLLEDIKQAINDKKIVTWGYDNDGDFYHTPEQWNYKAWLSPTISDNSLIFGIVLNPLNLLFNPIRIFLIYFLTCRLYKR